MKPPTAYARGILHFFGVIRRSTFLRSPSVGGSPLRIHPWAYAHDLLRRRIKKGSRRGLIQIESITSYANLLMPNDR